MLQLQGFPFERFADIIAQPQEHWEKFIRKVPAGVDFVSVHLHSPLVLREFERNGISPEEQADVIRKSLVLLYESLGSMVFTQLIHFGRAEAIMAVFYWARYTEPPIDDQQLREVDLQLSFLYAVVRRICLECGGADPQRCLYQLLNKISMPYGKHKFLVDKLIPEFENLRITRH